MINLTETEACLAARALLFSIANTGDDYFDVKFLVAKLMRDNLAELAFAAAAVYDATGEFPDIYPILKQLYGFDRASQFSATVKAIRTDRVAQGRESLPVIFVDEDGVAENVVFIADYEHLRKAA